MRRISRTLGLVLLTAALVGVANAPVASAQTGPVGYSVGENDGGCELFSIDLPTGVYTQVSDESLDLECADGLTFAPDGTLYAVARDFVEVGPARLITIDRATGAQTVIGNLPAVSLGLIGMTFDAQGALWLFGAIHQTNTDPNCPNDNLHACLWRVNPADASTQFVGAIDEPFRVTGLTASCTAGVLAITTTPINAADRDVAVQRVDTTNATLTRLVDTPDLFLPEGLDLDATGKLWALSVLPFGGIGQFLVSNIDLTTGAVTQSEIVDDADMAFLGFLNGLAVSPVTPCPTPEPVVLQPTFTG